MSELLGHVYVTGGTGCIGSATVHQLLELGAKKITVASRSGASGSLSLWRRELDDPRLDFVSLDLGDREAVLGAIAQAAPTALVHLGALQSPDCQNNPEHGLAINVGGTLHVLDAAERAGSVQRVVNASSAAVYGLRDRYPGDTVPESAELAPPNLYGVWKVAGEKLAMQFAERSAISTVSLRLNTTYGPGRDRGMTAAVTHAMRAVVAGEPYRMPYGGRENYHYVEDVAAHFAQCAAQPFSGYGDFNIRGRTVPVQEFLDTIAAAATKLGLTADLGFADDATPNPFVCDLDETAVTTAFQDMPRTELADGIERTLRAFQADG